MMTGANGKGITWRRKNASDLSIWILKGTGFYSQNLSQWCLCLGCFSWLHWMSQYKMQHNPDCPALFVFSLYGNWAVIFLWIHLLQLATVILQSQYISLAQSKEWRALWRKRERYYSGRERWMPLHKHITGSIHRNKITFFSNKVFFKIHVIWLYFKRSCVQPTCHYWHKLSGSELSYDYLLCKEDLFVDSSHIYLQGKVCRHR